MRELAEPPRFDWVEEAHPVVFRGSIAAIGKFLRVIGDGNVAAADAAPPGWSDDELLDEALRITGTVLT